MLTIEQLNQFGADTAEGIGRCAGMEALYLRLVKMVPNESNFALLQTSLEANDLDGGFAAAHALKGVLGNLSLTPMFETVSEMTELLRAHTEMDYTPMLNKLLDQKEQLTALCEG